MAGLSQSLSALEPLITAIVMVFLPVTNALAGTA